MSSHSRSPRRDDRAPGESLEQFRALVDDIGAILWEVELPDWRFTFVSHEAEGILGYPVRRWLEEPDFWVDILHPDDRARAVAECRQCVERGEDHELEYRVIAADGSVVWLRDIVRVVREEGAPPSLRGVMVDITASKNGERELQTRTSQLAAVTNAMTSFLESGNWREASAGLLRNALEQTESEYGFIGVVVGQTLRVLAHEGIEWDATVGRELYENALQLYEERGYLEFTSFQNLFGRVVTGQRTVLSNDPASDPRAGGLPPGHPPLRSFLGVPISMGDEVVGMVGIANRSGGYTGEEQSKLEIICRAVGVLYESYLRGLREDELQAQRRALETRLSQAQKMEALGQLAGGIAHDFNNLLTSILGNAEVAEGLLGRADEAPNTRSLLDAVEEIRRSGQRAADLTQQLLVFSRDEVTSHELLDANRVVRDLLRMLERVIGEHIRLDVKLAGGLPSIRADQTQLEQVILNLALNARDAMPNGGTLSIRTNEETDPAPEAEGTDSATTTHVVLEVRDDGHGMDPQTLERIFEPFFTTKPHGHGTGLGLATVYGIVSRAGGRILVDSARGRGSRFRVFIPAAREAADGASEETAGEAAGASRRENAPPRAEEVEPQTVLVCEDDDSVRRLMCSFLREAGYRVLDAATPREALRLTAQNAERISVLVTDVVMPELNGKLLAERIRHQCPRVEVLFVSGYTDDHFAQGVLGEHVELLRKPFTAQQLVEGVRRLEA